MSKEVAALREQSTEFRQFRQPFRRGKENIKLYHNTSTTISSLYEDIDIIMIYCPALVVIVITLLKHVQVMFLRNGAHG